MPRLSLYRPNRTADYRFFDRTISEMFTVGGLDLFVHKYLGPKVKGEDSGDPDATLPKYDSSNPLFIEDLLLGENRDRAYDADVYVMRGVYRTQDIDFDLTQFGLFLNNDTLFITFHYNDMIETFGRKLMSGDVLEVPNLKDYDPLDPNKLPLPKYYVIQDAAFASEGFSQTWLPHLWRVKATPMTNSQEYNDITNKPLMPNNIWDNGNFYPQGTVVQDGDNYYQAVTNVPPGEDINNPNYWVLIENPATVGSVASTRPKDLELNDAILVQAEAEVPLSGFDTVKFYIVPTNEDGTPANPSTYTADNTNPLASTTVANQETTPRGDGYTNGYLTGDGIAPNGLPVTAGVAFPLNPVNGQYVLRLDYFPNRLFRFNGSRWLKIEDNVRTQLTPGSTNNTLRSTFVNNTYTVSTTDQGNIPSRQSLSEVLLPKADNGNQGGNKPPKPFPDTQPGQRSS